MRPYLRAANVTWSGLDLSDVKEMDFTPAEQETYRLRRGDIVLSEASGSANEVGKPAVWNDEIEDCCFQNTLLRVRTHAPMTEYLYYHFLADAMLGRFGERSRGVGIHHLGAEGLSTWSVNLAPLAEQRRIVAAIEQQFTRLDAAVAALERTLANLKRYRAVVLKAACEGRLVPTEAELARAEGRDYESGSQLLARILAERRARWETEQHEKYTKSGKQPPLSWHNRYEEPVPPDTCELPELPEGWCWTFLRTVADLKGASQRARSVDRRNSSRMYPIFALPTFSAATSISPR
jgi:type I restriction enzyme S subunit